MGASNSHDCETRQRHNNFLPVLPLDPEKDHHPPAGGAPGGGPPGGGPPGGDDDNPPH